MRSLRSKRLSLAVQEGRLLTAAVQLAWLTLLPVLLPVLLSATTSDPNLFVLLTHVLWCAA